MANDDPVTVSSLGTVSIDVASKTGNGFVGKAQATDYTAGSIASIYEEDVKRIGEILNGSPTNQQGPLLALTDTDRQELSARISELKNLLVNGVSAFVDPSNPSIQKTYYLTTDMAQNLQLLFAGLQLVGVDVTGSTVNLSLQQANNLRNISTSSLLMDPLFNFAATAIAQNRSTQAMVELDFVKQGNNLLSNALSKLQSAIKATQTVLGQLGQLQEVHNQIVISGRASFSPTYFDINITSATSPSAYMAAYQQAASAYFSKPISPTTSLFPGDSAFFPTQVPADIAIINPNNAANILPTILVRAQDITNEISPAFFRPVLQIGGGPIMLDGILKATHLTGNQYQITRMLPTAFGNFIQTNLGISTDFNNQGDPSEVLYFLPSSGATYSTTFQQRYGLQNVGVGFSIGGANFSGVGGLWKVNPPSGSPFGTPSHDIISDYKDASVLTFSNFGSITVNNPTPTAYTTIKNVSTTPILDAIARIAPELSYSLVTTNGVTEGTGVLRQSELFQSYMHDFMTISSTHHFYQANLTSVHGDTGLYSVTDVVTGQVVATDVWLYQNNGSLNIPYSIAFYPDPPTDPGMTGGVSRAFLDKYNNDTGFGNHRDNGVVAGIHDSIPSTNGISFFYKYSSSGFTGGTPAMVDPGNGGPSYFRDPINQTPPMFADYRAFKAIHDAPQTQIGSLTTFADINDNVSLLSNIHYLNGRGFKASVDTPAAQAGLVWLGLINNAFKLDARGTSGFIQLQIELASIRGILSAQVPLLSAVTSAINVTAANPHGQPDPNSLLANLKKVLADLNRVFVNANGDPITSGMPVISALAGLRTWLLDSYNQRGTANATQSGQLQHNITIAITSGQSLNDTQQNDVRNFLFVFQQYYQAASTVIQQITQIIQNMASAISR